MLDIINNRVSVRSFLDKPVSDDQIREILRAAMNAPSGRNKQSWRFIVVSNREVLNKMSTLKRHCHMVSESAFSIVVLGDKELEERIEFQYFNLSAAIENMLLEAVNQGLGSCWCAISPYEEVMNSYRELFNLSDNLIPVACVAFGYSKAERVRQDQFKEDRITYIK